MNSRQSMYVAILAAVLPMTTSLAEDGLVPSDAPNVVIIMADMLGFNDIGVHGQQKITTPNIDALAEAGTRFTDAYSCACVASVSRGGLLTGRYPQRWKQAVSLLAMHPDELTFGELVKPHGYRTAWFGLWGQGGRGQHPRNQGFDEVSDYRGLNLQWDRKKTKKVKTRDGSEVLVKLESMRLHPASLDAKVPGHAKTDGGWRPPSWDERFAATKPATFFGPACDFIHRHAGQPFVMMADVRAPWCHARACRVEAYLDEVPNDVKGTKAKFIHARRLYLASTKVLDIGVGMILESLQEHKLDKNTLVIFLSDVGATHDGGDASPYRGHWYSLHEGGIRIPLIMRWPGRVPAGKIYDQPVSNLDLVPTIAAALGISLPNDRIYDGVDLLPYMTGSSQDAEPHPYLFWHDGANYRFSTNRAVRSGDWKLFPAKGSKKNPGPWLYNVREDPGESQNRAADHPEIVERMTAAFNKWQADMATASAHVKPEVDAYGK